MTHLPNPPRRLRRSWRYGISSAQFRRSSATAAQLGLAMRFQRKISSQLGPTGVRATDIRRGRLKASAVTSERSSRTLRSVAHVLATTAENAGTKASL
jgi:hypothetical protein